MKSVIPKVWRSVLLLIFCFSGLFTEFAIAAVMTGTVESVSTANQSLSLRIKSTDEQLHLTLLPNAKLVSGTKAITLSDIPVGASVTVTTTGAGNMASRISLRADAPAGKAPVAKKESSKKPPKTAPEDQPSQETPKLTVGDWPQFRGPLRDNISQEKNLLPSWPENGPAVVWSRDGFGEGYSSVALVGNTLYTLGTRQGNETLFALDRETGAELWTVSLGRIFQDGQGNGPRGTPTVDGDRVYALSAQGDLICVRAEQGEVVWKMNILETFQGNNIVWGISESVLIDGDKLICTPGGRQGTMVALDKMNGQVLWRSQVPGQPQAGYASPIPVTVGNVRQYVNFVHTAVVGIRASDGVPLWGQQASANDTANCSMPVIDKNLVFSASGYGTGGALLRLSSRGEKTTSEVLYTTKQMKNHHGGMVLLDGYLYGFDEQVLTCLDLRTGKPAWQNRSVGKGSLTCADGRLYLRSEQGPLALALATPEGYQELGRFDPPQRSGRPAWAHPVVAGGRLYIRDQDSLTVFNLRR